MPIPQVDELALVKAGAFSVYAQAGVPEEQWETKFAEHINACIQAERSAALIPHIKQALAEGAKTAAAAKPAATK